MTRSHFCGLASFQLPDTKDGILEPKALFTQYRQCVAVLEGAPLFFCGLLRGCPLLTDGVHTPWRGGMRGGRCNSTASQIQSERVWRCAVCENRDFRPGLSIQTCCGLLRIRTRADSQTADSGNKAVFQINYFVTHEVNMFGRCVGMLLLAGALLSLTGCNTVAGFGQDISGASRSVQRAL